MSATQNDGKQVPGRSRGTVIVAVAIALAAVLIAGSSAAVFAATKRHSEPAAAHDKPMTHNNGKTVQPKHTPADPVPSPSGGGQTGPYNAPSPQPPSQTNPAPQTNTPPPRTNAAVNPNRVCQQDATVTVLSTHKMHDGSTVTFYDSDSDGRPDVAGVLDKHGVLVVGVDQSQHDNWDNAIWGSCQGGTFVALPSDSPAPAGSSSS